MTERYGYDKTPTPPIDYDRSLVPKPISDRSKWVRTKYTGEDVAEAYAQGMEIAGLMANEALKAQAYDGNSLADVTLAKDGLPTLDARIRRDVNNLENKKADKTEVTAQLAQKAWESDLTTERERINNLIANAGNTDGNAELLDIRVGIDGSVYPTAGEAVRNVLSPFMTTENEEWVI